MEPIKQFLKHYGLSDKEIAVYLGCLRQGDGTVLQIARQANIKRPTTYLILEDLVARGLVNSKKDKKSIHYFPTHPKKLLTNLKNTVGEAEELMPEILSMYRDNTDKPAISIYEDMQGYQYTGDLVWDAMKRGEEFLVYGNVSFFFKEAPESADTWFKLIRNKKYKAKILIYGWGDTEREYVHRSRATGNPNLELRVITDPTYPVHTEQAMTEDIIVLFTGGQNFSSVVIHSKNLASTFRATFMQLWEQGVEPETLD